MWSLPSRTLIAREEIATGFENVIVSCWGALPSHSAISRNTKPSTAVRAEVLCLQKLIPDELLEFAIKYGNPCRRNTCHLKTHCHLEMAALMPGKILSA